MTSEDDLPWQESGQPLHREEAEFTVRKLVARTAVRRIWRGYDRPQTAYFVQRGWWEDWGFRVASAGWVYTLAEALAPVWVPTLDHGKIVVVPR